MGAQLGLSIALIVLVVSRAIDIAQRRHPFRVSFILGGPAAGKSTQSSKLVSEYGCVHLSAGDLLREERASGSELAQLIESYINNGAIVPVAITLNLIKNAMERSNANRFLIDGFPRNKDNLEGWEAAMKEACIVDSIIFLDCPEDECERRVIERSKTSGRSDDNPATLKKRFTTFKEMSMPVVRCFEEGTSSAGLKRVYRIAGDRPIEIVYNDVKSAYDEMVTSELIELTAEILKAEDAADKEKIEQLLPSSRSIISASYSAETSTATSTSTVSRATATTVDVTRHSTMIRPHVRLMGKSAIVSYVRLVQSAPADGGISSAQTSSYEETMVWQLDDTGCWANVHLHRVKLP
jgi:UMP-CMP kinase